MGKIANLLQNEEDSETPLQKKLGQLGKLLGFLALGVCAIIFLIGILEGMKILEIFMISVSLAVSAIPEGLPAIVTIVLSIGVQRMVKKNALIRRLPAVETLGGASVICSDKTGTLTQNRMTLTKAWVVGMEEPELISASNSERIKMLLMCGALCCDGSVVFDGDQEQHIGDPTETAIVLAAHKNGMTKEELNNQHPRLAEIPFDSDRKLMSTVNEMNGKKNAADFSSCWMLFTSDAEMANTEWGTVEYEGETLGSAILGAESLVVEKGEIYLWVYQSFH
jgi:Ca2+-transporting ATPase